MGSDREVGSERVTETERRELSKLIGGLWQSGDQLIAGRVRWLEERGVSFQDAKAVLADMAEAYERLPSIKDIAVKLAEHGTSVRAPLGIGNPAVIARMKGTILDGPYGLGGAREVCARTGVVLSERLRDELAAARANLESAITCDFGGQDYWRDMIRAYHDLLSVGSAAELPT